MKQVARILSTYTADASGVCSALYELGGLIVMHDASGCNSTYNTHDEPRWYDSPAMVYISALDEMSAVMGTADDKLVEDVVAAAKDLSPRFIALAGTPIPAMMGTDFVALARIIEGRCHIPAFGFPTNSMHSYQHGAGMALTAIAQRFCPADKQTPTLKAGQKPGVNLLGLTPLDFSVNGSAVSLRKFFERAGYPVISAWAMGSSLEDLRRAYLAQVNVVATASGLATARLLQARYGTPYVTGQPIGKTLSGRLLAAVDAAAQDGKNRMLWPTRQNDASQKPRYILGEAVQSLSLAEAMFLEKGTPVQVICPLEAEKELFPPQLTYEEDEDAIEALFAKASQVIADPLYQPLLPKDGSVVFSPLPHEAFSGRIYRAQLPDLIGDGWK